MKHRFCLISLAFLVLLFQGHALFAATLNVPSAQYPTIQSAIDAAVDGDTVLVADGVYTGDGNKNIDFKGKAITVRSENGPDNCVIDCEGDGGAFIFSNSEGPTSVVSGFQIRGTGGVWYDRKAGIHCTGASPTITNCWIKDGDGSWGIYLSNSSAIISNCSITGNRGDGVELSSASPTISNSTISGNSSGVRYDRGSSGTMTGCTIANNTDLGIYLSYSSSPIITNCTISGNNGGVYCSGSSPTFNKCSIINNNTTDSNGAGVRCENMTTDGPTFNQCIISGNVTTRNGGGLYFSSCLSPNLINCLITGNTAYGSGGGIYASSSSPKVTNCTISGNTAGSSGGVSMSMSVIKNAILWGNSPNTNSLWSNPTVTYSNIAGYSGPGTGNIDTDPLFVGGGDFQLTSGSPCINTGTTDGAPATDIAGVSRPQGAGVDMGAYEYTGGGHVRPTADAGPDQRVFDEVLLDGSGSHDPDGTIVTYQWQLVHRENPAHNRTATGVNPTVSNLHPGFYDVTLTVTDNTSLTDTDTMLLAAIGKLGDLNKDGHVDGADLQIFSTVYGR